MNQQSVLYNVHVQWVQQKSSSATQEYDLVNYEQSYVRWGPSIIRPVQSTAF